MITVRLKITIARSIRLLCAFTGFNLLFLSKSYRSGGTPNNRLTTRRIENRLERVDDELGMDKAVQTRKRLAIQHVGWIWAPGWIRRVRSENFTGFPPPSSVWSKGQTFSVHCAHCIVFFFVFLLGFRVSFRLKTTTIKYVRNVRVSVRLHCRLKT